MDIKERIRILQQKEMDEHPTISKALSSVIKDIQKLKSDKTNNKNVLITSALIVNCIISFINLLLLLLK